MSLANKCNNSYDRIKQRLLDRIDTEFQKKFFIGDIAISDQEYEILCGMSKQITAGILRTNKAVAESLVLAVTLVQIGIRKYDGKCYWPYVEDELGYEQSLKGQQLLGESFINTLSRQGKYITDVSERVQNILFHGFVSNYYSKGLFELLFQYYAKDLDRDIHRNTTDNMQTLMDTLSKKAALDEKQSEKFTDQFMEKGSRAYKLRNHTLQAISARVIHSRTRFRRILRLIDRAFWENTVPKNPSSRLTILFKEWVEDSSAFKKEYRLYQLGEIRNRGKKHFSTPYLFADIETSSFKLNLPAQIVNEEFSESLQWEIITNSRIIHKYADSYPVLTGYKTEENQVEISRSELFGEFHCQLIWENQTVRKFPHIPTSSVRFFDMEGDYAPRLFKIPMCAYTECGSKLKSKALESIEACGNICRWDFNFQYGDVVVLPDGTGMIVGDRYSEGFISRDLVSSASYYDVTKDSKMLVYADAPELLLTIPTEKIPGTMLFCNDTCYPLKDCEYTEFEHRDMRGVQAVLLPLEQFDFCKKDGIKTVVVDVPGTRYGTSYSFVLIKGLSIEFPGAPYIFDSAGAVLFPSQISISGEYEKLYGENGFKFVLNGNETELKVDINNIPISIQIPVFSWSTDKEDWSVLPAGELWHTEFFDIKKLYLRSPVNKISIFPDIDVDDETEDEQVILAEHGADQIYTIDMTRFRSWLSKKVMKNDIVIDIGGNQSVFATVYTRSLVVSYDVSADYEEETLTWFCDIIGKSRYYLDIVHLESGDYIAQKAPIVNGTLVLQDRLRTGLYNFILYEADEDDSGFDDPLYEELLNAQRKLTNRNDASGRVLELCSFKRAHNSNLYTYFKNKYYVLNFKKTENNIYKGTLITNGIDTGLQLTIEFIKSGDFRFFYVSAWHEEEECDVDLLFDRDMGSLELDQLPNLRSYESYRRYQEVSYGDFVYFGILHDEQSESFLSTKKDSKSQPPNACNVDPKTDKKMTEIDRQEEILITMPALPEKEIETIQLEHTVALTQNNNSQEKTILEKKEDDIPNNRNILLTELQFNKNIYFTLKQYGVETAGDIADLVPFAWKRMKQLKPADIDMISKKMKNLGLRIKK